MVRSGFVESVHTGLVVAVDPQGRPVLSLGDVAAPMLPRSSNKPVQAAAMVRLGVVEAFGLTDEHVAIGAASHSGETLHVDTVRDLLHRADVPESALQCPHDLPLSADAAAFLVRRELQPGRVHHNCSGKHALMLATCAANGWALDTYRTPDHPLQLAIRDELEDAARERVAATGVDGCGAPVLAVSLTALARSVSAIARDGAESHRARVAEAMRAHPELVGGTGRDVTALMRALPGLLAKDGAEGVYVAATRDGTAVAVKIADGSQRARTAVALAALRAAGVDVAAAEKDGVGVVPVLGGGEPVGELRVAARLSP